jgi:hypothetical protein
VSAEIAGRGEKIMVVELDAGRANQFPEVIWVDADKRGDAIILIFGSRVEGQGAALRVTLTSPQWENLKFLVERPAQGMQPFVDKHQKESK